jgi:hypothetical protein
MGKGWIAAWAAALLLTVGGCAHRGAPDRPAVGTCIASDGRGDRPVSCGEPHTYKVIANAPRPEACPLETDRFASPADPDLGTTTTCYVVDTATR